MRVAFAEKTSGMVEYLTDAVGRRADVRRTGDARRIYASPWLLPMRFRNVDSGRAPTRIGFLAIRPKYVAADYDAAVVLSGFSVTCWRMVAVPREEMARMRREIVNDPDG